MVRPQNLSIMILSLILGGMSARSGQASQIEMKTYTFHGTVDFLSDPDGVFDSSIKMGAPITLTASIDVDAYSHPDGIFNIFPGLPEMGISMTIGGTPVPVGNLAPGEPSALKVTPSSGSFSGSQTFYPAMGDPQSIMTRLEFAMNGDTKDITSIALPDHLNPADFSSASMTLTDFRSHDRNAVASAMITSVDVTTTMVPYPVPEPSTGLSFGVALLGLAGYRRRRRHSA